MRMEKHERIEDLDRLHDLQEGEKGLSYDQLVNELAKEIEKDDELMIRFIERKLDKKLHKRTKSLF